MKSFICTLLALSFVSNLAVADCDWSQATKQADGSYRYPVSLHICVGQLVQDNATKTQQITDLNKAIDLKNLALQNADARTQLWMITADKEQSSLEKISSDEKHSEWLFFGLGALTVIGAGFMTAKVLGR